MRVSRAKNVVAKGYESGWTLEIFKITRISSTRPPAVYYLEDLAGEQIDGFFYTEELCRVRKNLTSDVFEIEEILKTTGKGSSKEYFVKWKGYGDKFNSWVKTNQLTNIYKILKMKDQFYIVLPSNSSMNNFSENTTTHFITQLPQ